MMTDELIILRALLEKNSVADLLREIGRTCRATPGGVAGREPDRPSILPAESPAAQPPQRYCNRDWDPAGPRSGASPS
jgi:hypothetical protein